MSLKLLLGYRDCWRRTKRCFMNDLCLSGVKCNFAFFPQRVSCRKERFPSLLEGEQFKLLKLGFNSLNKSPKFKSRRELKQWRRKISGVEQQFWAGVDVIQRTCETQVRTYFPRTFSRKIFNPHLNSLVLNAAVRNTVKYWCTFVRNPIQALALIKSNWIDVKAARKFGWPSIPWYARDTQQKGHRSELQTRAV